MALLTAVSPALGAEDGEPEQINPDSIESIPVAQEDPEADPEPAPTQLDPIIVTATKRRESLRDLPASIVSLSGDDLEAMGAFEMRDFLRLIPGVAQTEVLTDLSRISIRGIQIDAGGNTPEATGLFIDDIPFNDPFINQVRPDLPPFDLEGIEVLKGPQGTLFGGSGLAGAIRYKLVDAQPGEWGFKSFVQYQDVAEGSPNRIGGAAANVPLGDTAALRLAGVRRLAGGVIDDVRNNETDTDSAANSSGRALLRWNVSDRLSLQLKGLHQQTRADDLSVAENTEGRLERERALRSSPSFTKFETYGLNLDWSLSWADLVSTTSLLHKFSDFRVAYAERILGVEDAGQPIDGPILADIDGFVQEIRLLSPINAGAWQWLAGVFAHDYASLSTQHIFSEDESTGQKAGLLDFVADVTARELALFGEVSRRLGERWNLTLGARAYSVETEGTVVSSGPIILATGSPENRNDAHIRATGINPKLALQFEASENVSSYLSVARGFRFGGIQIIGASPVSPNVPPTYSPDSLWSYELGLRTQWLGNTLLADGAVFYIDWKDPQVNTTTGGAVPLNVIDNAEGARSYGGELGLRYRTPINGLVLAMTAASTDARITAPFTAPNGATAPTGARLPGYADFQALAEIRYGWTMDAYELDASLTHVVQGDGVSDILQSLEIYDYQTTDFRFAILSGVLPGRPRLSFGATNLTDERAVVSALVQSADNYTTVYNRPRTYDLRLDLSF